MTQARYIGDPRFDGQGPEEVRSCNHSFVKDEWINISEEAAVRLSKNNHFEVKDGEAEPTASVEDLRAALDEKGIAYHPKAGVKKLSALLAEAA